MPDTGLPDLNLPDFKFPSAEGYELSPDWEPTYNKPLPALRCYYVRDDGTRCKRFAVRGTGLNGTHAVCPSHGGSLPVVKAHAEALIIGARMRLVENADLAVDTLLELLQPGTSAQVRLKASTELMDRIGLKGAPDLAITVEHSISPSETIAKKLASIALRLTPPAEPEDLGEVEDADIIDEPQEAPLESASTNK